MMAVTDGKADKISDLKAITLIIHLHLLIDIVRPRFF